MHSDTGMPYTPSAVALPKLINPSSEKRNVELVDKGTSSHSDDLQQKLAASAQAWQSLQLQIKRGEDCYIEESGVHNIYKGWEGYMDSRVTEAMPKRYDHRWFSSGMNVVRHVPYNPLPQISQTNTAPTPQKRKRS